MEVFINYTRSNDVFLEKLALFKAEILIKQIELLNLNNNDKMLVLRELIRILDEEYCFNSI